MRGGEDADSNECAELGVVRMSKDRRQRVVLPETRDKRVVSRHSKYLVINNMRHPWHSITSGGIYHTPHNSRLHLVLVPPHPRMGRTRLPHLFPVFGICAFARPASHERIPRPCLISLLIDPDRIMRVRSLYTFESARPSSTSKGE